MQYYMQVTVEVWDDYQQVHDLFKYNSVNISFWKSIVPPHRAVYTIGPLSQTGVENWKKEFDAIGCKYKAEVREVEKQDV